MKIKKFYFCLFAFFVAMVMLFNFVGLKTAPVVWAATSNEEPDTTDMEEVSINNLIDNADLNADEDGYTLQASGYLNMEEDQENNIDAGEYYISINATYNASDNYLYVEVSLITPTGDVIEFSGGTSVLSDTAQESYNNMSEEDKESIRSSANTETNEETSEYDEFVEQGGISVDSLALILDITVIVLSFLLTVASFAVVTWQAAQISSGLTRNILSKVAMKALKSFLAANTLQNLIGNTLMEALISLFNIICSFANVSIGSLIATAIDCIDGNENGRCFA